MRAYYPLEFYQEPIRKEKFMRVVTVYGSVLDTVQPRKEASRAKRRTVSGGLPPP